MFQNIGVRKALRDDARDFADLIILSAPSLFPTIYGDEVKTIMQHLARQRCNLFSFEHTYFAELNGKKAGMIVGYDWRTKKRENWRTGFLLLIQMKVGFLGKLPLMMKVRDAIGMVSDREYYISNVAIYQQYRGMGIGTRLLLEAEEEAKRSSAERLALDVELGNHGAIRLYKRLGYSMVGESSVKLRGAKPFHFCRMCKEHGDACNAQNVIKRSRAVEIKRER